MKNELILITKMDCDKCEWLKNRIEKEELNVKMIDVGSVDAISHMAFHELLGDSTNVPILLINDDQHMTGEATLKILKEIRQNNGKTK